MTVTEEKITVDTDRVLELLELVVNREGPDTIREGRYVRNGEPFCIAACVLNKLGVSRVTLAWEEGRSVHRFRHLVNGVLFTNDAMDALRAAQIHQDNGGTWGEALECARSVVKEQSE